MRKEAEKSDPSLLPLAAQMTVHPHHNTGERDVDREGDLYFKQSLRDSTLSPHTVHHHVHHHSHATTTSTTHTSSSTSSFSPTSTSASSSSSSASASSHKSVTTPRSPNFTSNYENRKIKENQVCFNAFSFISIR